MDKIMTPREWLRNKTGIDDTEDGIVVWNPVWTDYDLEEYAAYVVSNQPKKDIILPEYIKDDGWNTEYAAGNKYAIDEVKRLNNLNHDHRATRGPIDR